MDGVWLGTGGEVTEGFLISVVMRLLVAAVSGGIVGFERGLKGRPAGLKTFSLVCIGAAMVMVTNEYIMLFISGGSGDAARMTSTTSGCMPALGGSVMTTSGIPCVWTNSSVRMSFMSPA